LGSSDTLQSKEGWNAYLCPRCSKTLCNSGGDVLQKHFAAAVREQDILYFDDFNFVASRLVGPTKSQMKIRYFVIRYAFLFLGSLFFLSQVRSDGKTSFAM
jgi:hypothetical protein